MERSVPLKAPAYSSCGCTIPLEWQLLNILSQLVGGGEEKVMQSRMCGHIGWNLLCKRKYSTFYLWGTWDSRLEASDAIERKPKWPPLVTRAGDRNTENQFQVIESYRVRNRQDRGGTQDSGSQGLSNLLTPKQKAKGDALCSSYSGDLFSALKAV